jgi:preprotein translocase subunit SecB
VALDPAAQQQEQAARVAAWAEIRDIRMLGCNAHIDRFVDEEALTFSLNLNHKVEHEKPNDYFAVRVEFDLKVELADDPALAEDEDRAVFQVEFEFGALYTLEGYKGDAPSDEEFQAYAETSATLTLFPYAREFISDTTQRFGLPKLTIPPHRLPSPWHREEDAAAQSDQDN